MLLNGGLGHSNHAKGHQALTEKFLGAYIASQTPSSVLVSGACLITDYCLMKFLTQMKEKNLESKTSYDEAL